MSYGIDNPKALLDALDKYARKLQTEGAKKHLLKLKEQAESPETIEAIEAVLQSPHIIEDAKLFFDYDGSYDPFGSVYNGSRQIGKYAMLNGLYGNINKVLVGPTKPAKPEPDWKHPIPVKSKSDGPSKIKRAKLRARRKK